MKIIILFIFLATIIFTGCSQSPSQIKSCKIDFVFSNGLQHGTKTIVFDDSGRVDKEIVLTIVDTSLRSKILMSLKGKFPMQVNNRVSYHILKIQTIDSVFLIDLDSMTGNKRARFNMDMDALTKSKEKTIGKDTFLNKTCDIIDFNGFKIWYWKGIALKKEMLVGNTNMYEYAISIDENYIIKPNEFSVPPNIKMQ